MLDTVRQDHLSLYGYERNTSPTLATFADYATVYNNAYATSRWSPPSREAILAH